MRTKYDLILIGAISIIATALLLSCSSKKDYRILYGKAQNSVHLPGGSRGCKQLSFTGFAGGGIVQPDNKENKNLKFKGFPTGFPRSKKYKNYYYIDIAESPQKNVHGYTVFDRSLTNQALESTDFKSMKSQIVIGSTPDRYPSMLITSPDNRYLIYVMTKRGEEKSMYGSYDPYSKDSDLIIRDIKRGKEHVVIKDSYNKQLFDSFLNFTKEGDAIFTIMREGEGFKFVKIELDSGRVTDLKEEFPKFDWNGIEWKNYYTERRTDYAHFSMSPDETILMAYRSDVEPVMVDKCIPDSHHKLEAFDINNDKITIYDEGIGALTKLYWKKESDKFAFVIITGGGCWPEYLDSTMYRMGRDGKNKEELVTEKGSKMLEFGWSPDGKKIAYSVYGSDLVGWIKTVDPENKEVINIVSSQETEGQINKERPVTLFFMDWVVK